MLAWLRIRLRRWLSMDDSGRTEVFVVCVRGIPINVCLEEDDVRAVLTTAQRRDVSVHRVGFVAGTAHVSQP